MRREHGRGWQTGVRLVAINTGGGGRGRRCDWWLCVDEQLFHLVNQSKLTVQASGQHKVNDLMADR